MESSFLFLTGIGIWAVFTFVADGSVLQGAQTVEGRFF